jgi:uncharacterized membrane-anchored protein
MDDRFANNDLVIVLNQLAVDWAAEAERYRHDRPQTQARERAFWFGMSRGFVDSTSQLLKLLRQPTVQGVITLAQVLNRRQAQAERRFSSRRSALNLKVAGSGAAEAYGYCSDHLTLALVGTLRSRKSPVDYRC